MKVYNYLELEILHIQDGEKWVEQVLRIRKTNFYQENSNADITHFYYQKFKPEMIAELFEVINNYKFEFLDYPNGCIMTIKVQNREIRTYYNILTLNDFIRDCQRAGIELQWRPEPQTKEVTNADN